MKHKHVQKDYIKRRRVNEASALNLALKTLQNAGIARHPEAKFGHGFNYRNRCVLTGRPRGVYMEHFKISRLMIRELASKGLLPGLKKASW
jgi:small subunit ribosomal protein S14